MKKIFKDQKRIIAGFSNLHDGNISFKWSGEKPLENRVKFLEQLDLQVSDLVMAQQTHSQNIRIITQQDQGRGARQKDWVSQDDGLITQEKDLILGIETADCLPILAYDPVSKTISAIHAGWRGVVKGISMEMVKKFVHLGSQPKNVVVWVGPHIQRCCFLVRNDIIDKFESYDKFIEQNDQGFLVDLSQIVKHQLIAKGIQADNILFDHDCTCCNKNYYSWRRDGQQCTGAMLTVICQ